MGKEAATAGNRAREAMPLLLLAVLFAGLAVLSWRRWPDPLIDYGRELYLPWAIGEGKVLYRDLAHFYGPLSAYLHAALFRILGPGFLVLAGFNLLVVAGYTVLILGIFTRLSDWRSAAVCAFLFLAIFAFAHHGYTGSGNFVCPYSHELTHGMLLCLVAVFLFHRSLRGPETRWPFLVGFCVGLVALTKVEPLVAIVPALGMGELLSGRLPGEGRNRRAIRGISGLVGFLVPTGLFLLYFSLHMGWKEALGSLVFPVLLVGKRPLVQNPFFLDVSGAGDPVRNVGFMGLAFLGYALGLIWILLVCRSLTAFSGNSSRGRILPVLSLVGLFLVSLAGIARISWLDATRGLPLVLVVFVAWFGRRVLRPESEMDREAQSRLLARFVLSLFALLLMGKVLLRATLDHYGIWLTMPAFLIAVSVFVSDLPDRIPGGFGKPERIRRWIIAVVVAGAIPYGMLTATHYLLKNTEAGPPGDRFLVQDPGTGVYGKAGPILSRTLELLGQHGSGGQSLAVLPEGVILNYWSRMRNPTPYHNFIPTTLRIFGEENILRSLRESPPDWILLANRPTAEFGARDFGIDYGKEIGRWIRERYRVQDRVGASFRSGGEPAFVLMRYGSAGTEAPGAADDP